jgi:hypothetical protein
MSHIDRTFYCLLHFKEESYLQQKLFALKKIAIVVARLYLLSCFAIVFVFSRVQKMWECGFSGVQKIWENGFSRLQKMWMSGFFTCPENVGEWFFTSPENVGE